MSASRQGFLRIVKAFHALMLMHNLGPGYLVCDKAASIRYVKPGRDAERVPDPRKAA